MTYDPDTPLPLVEPKYGYPGNPGPSTWERFGLGQVDPPGVQEGRQKEPSMNHFYGDLSNLNAPYDAVPLQGLGADDPKYPWKKNSKDTLYLQQDINEGLASHGLCPIVEDGYLGPATCGALGYFVDKGVFPASVIPSTCVDHKSEAVAPRSKPCGSSAAVIDTSETPANPTEGGAGKVPAWAIGVGVGVVAIGVALYLKKNKRRR